MGNFLFLGLYAKVVLHLIISNNKKPSVFEGKKFNNAVKIFVHPGGLEPPTNRLRVYCSTN